MLTSLLQESQRLIKYAFVMLLLAMISLHMLTFRLMVTMVAEFCSLVILIHNTLLGEITISSTWTTRVNEKTIPLFPSTYWYISTCKDSISLILWLLSYASSRRIIRRRRRWKTWQNVKKMWKALFEILRLSYITDQLFFVSWLFFTYSSPWYH